MDKIEPVVFENKRFDYPEKLKLFSLAGSDGPWSYQFQKYFTEI